MKLPFSIKSTAELWPICVDNPRTVSFRINTDEDISRINNYYSCAAAANIHSDDTESAVIEGLNSDRLFFEPGETNFILEKPNAANSDIDTDKHGGGGCAVAVVEMESDDPYLDFRSSMDEMVEAQGLTDWEELEELLAWYLRINSEINHGYIVEAFLDLVIGLGMVSAVEEIFAFSSLASSSITAPVSFSTSPLSFSSSSSPSHRSSASCARDDHQIDEDKNPDAATAWISSK